jgi:hypothetical protein
MARRHQFSAISESSPDRAAAEELSVSSPGPGRPGPDPAQSGSDRSIIGSENGTVLGVRAP